MADTPKPTTYRFTDEVNEQIDRIAAHLQALTGSAATRADALRFAVKETLARVGQPRKTPKGE